MYVNYIVLRWMICTNWIFCTCNIECVLTIWKICTVIEWFGGKYPPEDCLGIFSPMKISTINTAPWKKPLVEAPPVIIALQQMKKQTSLNL